MKYFWTRLATWVGVRLPSAWAIFSQRLLSTSSGGNLRRQSSRRFCSSAVQSWLKVAGLFSLNTRPRISTPLDWVEVCGADGLGSVLAVCLVNCLLPSNPNAVLLRLYWLQSMFGICGTVWGSGIPTSSFFWRRSTNRIGSESACSRTWMSCSMSRMTCTLWASSTASVLRTLR
uniref:Putative secreted protein n=1 Tax=Ixodes ricinus TaxID=34613 RepID=A0A6B0UZ84_IXORI